MTPDWGQLWWRLALLGLVLVVVQITAVSQVQILGIHADLAPLLVASVGLLAGSMAGAVTGFAIGLFVDLALVQTLGLSSLLYILVGYWAGRLHELRDPSHGLVPVAVGAAATAVAQIGYAVIQLLLGVDAPVSVLLIREILATIIAGALLALPLHALLRRVLAPGLPEGPRRPRRGADRTRSVARPGLSPLQRPSAR